MISDKTHVNIPRELEEGAVIHTNLTQAIIITTDDKVRLCLSRHFYLLQGKTQWATPAGILITLFATLGTADFKPTLGRPAAFWEAFFSLGALAAAAWLCISLARSIRCWKRGSLDGLVAMLKAEDVREKRPESIPAANVATLQ